LVAVNDLKTSIAQTGYIAIYDIYFDGGKSEVKPELAEVLKNIAEFLNTNKDKKYIVVGHTDNIGEFEANIKLSQQRAEAVKNELISRYGVSADQLSSYGVGSTVLLF